jgi:hypothetical protein
VGIGLEPVQPRTGVDTGLGVERHILAADIVLAKGTGLGAAHRIVGGTAAVRGQFLELEPRSLVARTDLEVLAGLEQDTAAALVERPQAATLKAAHLARSLTARRTNDTLAGALGSARHLAPSCTGTAAWGSRQASLWSARPGTPRSGCTARIEH